MSTSLLSRLSREPGELGMHDYYSDGRAGIVVYETVFLLSGRIFEVAFPLSCSRAQRRTEDGRVEAEPSSLIDNVIDMPYAVSQS